MGSASAEGALSLSSVYSNLWLNRVPEVCRFITSSSLGNIAFFQIDKTLYNSVILPLVQQHQSKENGNALLITLSKILKKNKESVSFLLAYLIQIAMQHFLNALLVYGLQTIGTREKYFDTLILTYSSYSMSMIGSTVGNAILIKRGVEKNVAFWSTILGFGVINFFLLKYLIGNSKEPAQEPIQDSNKGKTSSSSTARAKNTNRNPVTSRFSARRTARGGHQQKRFHPYETVMKNLLSRSVLNRNNDSMLAFVKTAGGERVCVD